MIFDTGVGFYTAANVNTVRANAANGFRDIFNAETAGEKESRRIDLFHPLPRKRIAGTAVARRPGIQQIEIRRKVFHLFQRFPFFQPKRLDHFHSPTLAIVPALFTVKLQTGERLPFSIRLYGPQHLLHFFTRFINKHCDFAKTWRQVPKNRARFLLGLRKAGLKD